MFPQHNWNDVRIFMCVCVLSGTCYIETKSEGKISRSHLCKIPRACVSVSLCV